MFLEHVRSTHWYSRVIWISHKMEWLHCFLCYCSLWHHNAATIAYVMSQMCTQLGVLGNKKAAILVQQSSNNPHDINCLKSNFNGRNHYIYPLKQHMGNTIKFGMHDKSENICCFGIWQWTTLGWCYPIALEDAPIPQLSNTSLAPVPLNIELTNSIEFKICWKFLSP